MKQLKSLKKQGGWWQFMVAAYQTMHIGTDARNALDDTNILAKESIELVDIETTEELRRLKNTQEQIVGETKARIAASGFTDEGTFENFQDELEREYQSRRSFIQRSAAANKRIIKQQRNISKNQIRSERDKGILGAIKGGFSL